jgi:beta-N-acetylglucosaminidase
MQNFISDSFNFFSQKFQHSHENKEPNQLLLLKKLFEIIDKIISYENLLLNCKQMVQNKNIYFQNPDQYTIFALMKTQKAEQQSLSLMKSEYIQQFKHLYSHEKLTLNHVAVMNEKKKVLKNQCELLQNNLNC